MYYSLRHALRSTRQFVDAMVQPILTPALLFNKAFLLTRSNLALENKLVNNRKLVKSKGCPGQLTLDDLSTKAQFQFGLYNPISYLLSMTTMRLLILASLLIASNAQLFFNGTWTTYYGGNFFICVDPDGTMNVRSRLLIFKFSEFLVNFRSCYKMKIELITFNFKGSLLRIWFCTRFSVWHFSRWSMVSDRILRCGFEWSIDCQPRHFPI